MKGNLPERPFAYFTAEQASPGGKAVSATHLKEAEIEAEGPQKGNSFRLEIGNITLRIYTYYTFSQVKSTNLHVADDFPQSQR